MGDGAGGIDDYTTPAFVALATLSMEELRGRVISEMKLEQQTPGGREDDLVERILYRLGYRADYKNKPLVDRIERIVVEERRRQFQELAQRVRLRPFESGPGPGDEGFESQEF